MSPAKPRYDKPVSLPGRVRHGSLRAYNHYGCRCEPCVDKRNTYDREYWELARRSTARAARRKESK